MQKVNLGGDRLGSGSKNNVEMRNYDRSTHNLRTYWRSTMSAGTLVPFMSHIGLPGTSFDIDLDVDVRTHPTIGPLFGSFKVQLDVFQIPIRLYHKDLYQNSLNIGLDIAAIKLPQVEIRAGVPVFDTPIDNQQINSSCIFKHLGIAGVGFEANNVTANNVLTRKFNACDWLGYWDTVKNYYINKQEDNAYVIHNPMDTAAISVSNCYVWKDGSQSYVVQTTDGTPASDDPNEIDFWLRFNLSIAYADQDLDRFRCKIKLSSWGNLERTFEVQCNEIWQQIEFVGATGIIFKGLDLSAIGITSNWWDFSVLSYSVTDDPSLNSSPKLQAFAITDIDDMRDKILTQSSATALVIDKDETLAPYKYVLNTNEGTKNYFSCQSSQEGLAVKTYQSDLFNNWMQTEWLDGVNGIAEVSKVDTTGNEFTIDELNLSYKIHRMLMRVGIKGGSYDDWQEAVYDQTRWKMATAPVYLGGLITELAFQEVFSQSATPDAPLGTLAGRGALTGKRKGGKVTVKCNEPCYIMGIVSITPRIDYSQGNRWDKNLITLDDFHKPALDSIGFQDLVTDQMAWFDTQVSDGGTASDPVYKSAGKVPAWINYMTDVNEVRGNFADELQQMWMTLNRRYDAEYDDTNDVWKIGDLTTYIDPAKFNHIFADRRLDAQNFWVQIERGITARRKMSAKIIPNL